MPTLCRQRISGIWICKVSLKHFGEGEDDDSNAEEGQDDLEEEEDEEGENVDEIKKSDKNDMIEDDSDDYEAEGQVVSLTCQEKKKTKF
jgi:hypothetical protein